MVWTMEWCQGEIVFMSLWNVSGVFNHGASPWDICLCLRKIALNVQWYMEALEIWMQISCKDNNILSVYHLDYPQCMMQTSLLPCKIYNCIYIHLTAAAALCGMMKSRAYGCALMQFHTFDVELCIYAMWLVDGARRMMLKCLIMPGLIRQHDCCN
jgi:hypothetical protein